MYKVISKNEPVLTTCISALIYGEPGIGKTSLSFTAKDSMALDFDGGVQRACYRGTTIRMESWEDVIEFQVSGDFKKINPKTIIIDTAGAMLDNFIANYVKQLDPKNRRRGGELSLQGYGAMKDTFYQFKNWAKSLNINIIFIAHATTMEEGDNTKFIPKVTGGSYDILRQECDLIGYFYSYQNKRTIDFNPTDQHIGKNCAEIEMSVVPNYTNADFETYFQNIIDQTLNKMNQLSEEQLHAQELVDGWKNKIAAADSHKAMNKLVEELTSAGLTEIVNKQIFSQMKKAAKEIGLKWDAKSKEFVIA